MSRIHHMVLLQFKSETSPPVIDSIMAELAGLRNVIDGIEHFAGGPYSSEEGLHGGFTHGFLMTFRDAAARDAYLPHPEHERVKQQILPHVDSVIAFDIEDAS